jgi:hypothetical protein
VKRDEQSPKVYTLETPTPPPPSNPPAAPAEPPASNGPLPLA